MPKTRANVWKLPATDDTLLWYGRAVAAMRARAVNDPLSWRYQAAIHDYDSSSDPLAAPDEVLPSSADQEAFWRQCQHGSWFFLPWHRMYLHHFESIVAAEVARQGGPADWALPYWNYSESDAASLLPDAFRNPTMPDGTANPLYVEQRDPSANAGTQFVDSRSTDIVTCLSEHRFQGGDVGSTTGFGGPTTKFEHSGGVTGLLEATPHGSMHVGVGGESGWMSAFNTAPLDPIFWLHHSNIDRLWEVWLKRDVVDDKNPATAQWLSSVSFQFHDSSSNVVTMTPVQVLDTTAAPLSYVYDDTSDPLATAPPAMAASLIASKAIMPPAQPPEMVGATSAELVLDDTPTHAKFPVHRATGPARALAVGRSPRRLKVYLNIENVSCTQRAPPFDVYLNVPEGTNPHDREDLFVGRMPLFGLVEASQPRPTHPGSGLHYVFEVTAQYERLAAQPGWDPSMLRVSFVPTRTPTKGKVRVGRVSLYLE
jgi:tyrosinase